MNEFLVWAKTNGLTAAQAATLARTIAESGARLPNNSNTPRVSVHSTGAPGSLTTLICPPILAAMGFSTPVLSVDGGIAGAIDSLRTVTGHRSSLSPIEAEEILARIGLVHLGHGDGVYAPADHVLWNAREATATKGVPGLIAASLLSKKLAMGATAGVIDVRGGAAGNAAAPKRI